MDTKQRLKFGKYVETLRKSRGKSLRETAKAIKVVNGKYFPTKNGNYFPALFGK